MKKILVLFSILICVSVYGQEFSYKEKKELKGYADYIMDSKFSPYRNYFALTVGDNSIEIYDKDWNKIFSHQGNPKSVGGHLSFSPDEKYLAYAKYKSDNDIAIIRLEDRKVIQVLNGHSRHITKLEFSHNGNYLASSSSDETVCIWKWDGDQMILQQKLNYDESVNGVSFNYNDEYLLIGGYDKKIYVYKHLVEKYELSDTVPNLKYWLYDVCFHPFKNEFVVSSQYEVRRYDLRKGKIDFKDSLKIRVNSSINYNSTGEYLVFGNTSDLVILKMTSTEIQEFESIYRHSDYVFGGTFSDDGLFLTSFSSDKSVIVWELTGVKPSRKSLITDYMDGELTSAHKMILTSEVIENILEKLDKNLTLPRDEFETTIQYSDRREKLKAEVLAQLQNYTEKYFDVKSKAGGKVEIPIERLIGYNADLQIYKVRFLETDAGIKIPIDEAKLLKKNWSKAYLQASKSKNNDGISYKYSAFELVHPVSKKVYSVTPVENPFHIVKKGRSVDVKQSRSEDKKVTEVKKTAGMKGCWELIEH